MRRFVDLHTHSTASDGATPPAELIRLADGAGLAAVALTDHDTTCGLAEARTAAETFPELALVAGIEISAKWPDGTLHILGLGIDERAASIQRIAGQLRQARAERNPKIIEKLRQAGIEIDMADVEAVAAGYRSGPDRIVGRLHIAEALRRKGHVRSIEEAFARYIADDGPAFVDKERLSPAAAITAIHKAGGQAVLAHPVQLRYTNSAQLGRMVTSLQGMGLDGIEIYHHDHTDRQTRLYLELARQKHLGVTGGSDFHGWAKPEASLGRPKVIISALGETWLQQLLRDVGPTRGELTPVER